MKRIAWPQLMRLGFTRLGLTPDVFWNLSPVELMLIAGLGDADTSLTREGFADLSARFPDQPRTSGLDEEE